jgi:hypothetical protein
MKYSYGILIFITIILAIIIYSIKFVHSLTKNSLIDGFENQLSYTKWSPDLIRRFNIYQTTVNENANQFNLDVLQQQATPEEAEEYLKTGLWPWTDELKNLYIEKVWANPIIKIDPHYALNYAMKIYNKNAVTELLAWNTKEGHFLLYGGDIGVTDGMPPNMNNTIKCSADSVLEKKVYTGMNLWNGYMNYTKTVVKPEDIPKEMPGFSFVKGPCNPCVALNSPRDFSCPFRLNVKGDLPSVKGDLDSYSVKGDDSISYPWKKIWNL